MIKISKMICGLIISSTILFANDDTAINYLQNYNNSILVKESVSKLNNLTNSIGSYIVNTGGNPSVSGTVLSLNLNKTNLKDFNNMSDEDFYKLDGSKSDVSYTLQYDSSNKIPIGINFKKSDLFGNTNFDLSNQKVIAYLNSNGIIVNPDSSLTKYFNNTTMSTIKQEYYIIKDNSNIQIIDITSPSYNNLPNDTIAYSPDGKGGFLIYQKSNSNWNVIGEPKIQLAVNSSDNLNDIKLPIGDSVIVLDEGGKAIQYTMQSSLNSDGSETSSNVWNKTTGSYEKNYYFNPIKISDISLGISAELQRALGSWDSHTHLSDTYIDSINYNSIYKTEKNIDGTDKLDGPGNPIYKLDEGGKKIMIAQSLESIMGYISYYGGHTTGSDGKLYFEILSNELNNNKNVRFIGHNYANPEGSSCGAPHLSCDVVILKPGSVGKGQMVTYSHNLLYKGITYESRISNLNQYTSQACHHNTSQCVYLPTLTIANGISTSEFNMKLGCLNDARISYYSDITKKTILKNKGELVNVNVKPLTNGNHLITFGSGINEKFESSNFDITYITAETFGNLQCIQRNSTSNYGTNY